MLKKVTDKAFNMLFDLFRELVPNGKEKLAKSFYILNKVIDDLRLLYEGVDAFLNDCMLY